jgi:hypothetical protein
MKTETSCELTVNRFIKAYEDDNEILPNRDETIDFLMCYEILKNELEAAQQLEL